MAWGTYWFTRRDGVWHIAGPLQLLRWAAATGTPIKVSKRDSDCWVRITPGSVTEEKHGGITAQFTTMPDGFVGDEAIQGDEQEWLWR